MKIQVTSEIIDKVDMCLHCREDTKFGSGKFVNRYPVFGLFNDDLQQGENGYCCDDCEDQYYKDNPEMVK